MRNRLITLVALALLGLPLATAAADEPQPTPSEPDVLTQTDEGSGPAPEPDPAGSEAEVGALQQRSGALSQTLPQQDGEELDETEAEETPVSVSAATAGITGVNFPANVWGVAQGAPNAEAWTEVRLSNGAWSRSQTGRTSASGYYALPLTYARSSASTQYYRVAVRTDAEVVRSETVELTRIAVVAATAGTTGVGTTSNVWGTAVGAPNSEIWTEAWVGQRWSRSRIATTDANGYFVIPLTYGQSTPGTWRYRVGVRTNAGTLYSDEVEITRVSLTAANAGFKEVSFTSNVWGSALGAPHAPVWTEVRLPDGRWSRSQTRQTDANGAYVIPLTYGLNTEGTYTFRVGVETAAHVVYSSSFTFTRVANFIPDSRCMTGRVFCASKTQKKMAWMVNGEIIEVADARFGGPRTPTRNGDWNIFRWSKHHVSSIYGSRMPFSLFFSGGQAIHYSDNFAAVGWAGGASGGCINLRDWGAAERFYNNARPGDRVVVFN